MTTTYLSFLRPGYPRFSGLVLALVLLGLTFSSCQRDRRAAPLPDSVNAYVYAFTSGVIAKNAPVRLQFASVVADAEAVGGPAPSGLITFAPAVSGKLIWEDRQTVRFEPDPAFENGVTYIATVQLSKVFDNLPADARSFEFDFRIRDQFYNVEVDGISYPDVNQLAKPAITGTVYTADQAEASAVEGLLTARQQRRELTITWQHDAAGLVHSFVVNGASRGEAASSVELAWNGRSLGVDHAGEQAVEILSLNDFKVTDVRPINGPDPHLAIRFSDPLDTRQQLAGLVTVSNAPELRFVIEGNLVRAYPGVLLSGEQEVNVSAGVRNLAGKAMPRASRWEITISSPEPQVRLVGRGVILPGGEGLYLPFEAIGLQSVDVEVFKIFHNNILQFLQTNDLDQTSDYELYRVGRVVLRRRVTLQQLNPQTDPAKWMRYALDLGPLIAKDEQAIYQVRIGFRAAYAAYPCAGAAAASDNLEDMQLTASLDEDDEQESIMNWWYGPDGYYPEFEWDHREDPCQPGYYNSSRFVQRNVLASNLGIIAKGSSDGKSYLTVVTDLLTAEPVGQVKLQFYDLQQQLLAEVTTDGKGLARAALPRKPLVIVAQRGNQRGYLRLGDAESLSLSRFDVEGTAPQRGMKGFLYGDRGVWRPGDSVYLNFILEDRLGVLPPNYPVQFELLDARGQLRERRAAPAAVGRTYALHFATRPDDPTGIWLARVKVGGAVFEKSLRIETVKPNRLKIDLKLPDGEALYAQDETPRLGLTAQWLHGAPAGSLRAVVEATFRPNREGFTNFKEHVFYDPTRAFDPSPTTLFEGNLDATGGTDFAVAVPSSQPAPGKMTLQLRSRVFENSGDFSNAYRSVAYFPYTAYAGVALPTSRYGEKRVEINQPAELRFASVDAAGKAISGRKLSVGIYRLEWRWWWDDDGENMSQYNSATHVNALSRQEVTTNSRGVATWKTQVDSWGRYMVRVCDTETGHCAGDYFYAGYPWYGDDDAEERFSDEAAMLMFNADKEKYNVGETVKLTIPASEAGRVLVTLENGSGVLEANWIEAKAGDNTYTFKTSSEMAPTVYAHVMLIQPHGQTQNNLPIRLYGVIPIGVEDPASRITPQLQVASEWQPDTEATITVKEAKGQAMTYTLAVVDEGLLSLTNFKTPDPWNTFYAREALGVRTWDVFDHVLGAFGGQIERILSIGGDGDLVRNPDADRANRFKPVVRHLGPFRLERGRSATHKIRIPNYVGAVRVMAVAEGDGAYGAAEANVPVRKPLMVLATLPRVLGPGETLKLPVSVFATNNRVRAATVRLEEKSGLVRINGNASRSVSFSGPSDKLVDFDLAVGEATGVARFTITAEGNGERATETIEIQVRNPNPVVTKAENYTLEPGQEMNLPYTQFGTRGSRTATLEVANLPPLNLGRRLNYLLQYPYGCLEQTLSGGFPQLYLAKLIELNTEQRERIPRNIAETISRLAKFQTGNGGFGYWPGHTDPDQWSTSYAGHFLLEAKALGHTLPPAMLERWISFQQSAARKWDPSLTQYGYFSRASFELNQAYRLYTLALAQRPEMSAMNQLREQPNLLPAARWRLAAAYALAGQNETARNLLNGLSTDVDAYRELSYTYGSDVRDRAMILETLTLLKDQQRAGQQVLKLSRDLSAQRWLSTQDISYCLLAIGKYVGQGEVNQRFTFTFTETGKAAVDAGSDRPLMQVRLRDPGANQGQVRVKNTSRQKLFVSIILEGQPLVGEESPQANNLNLQVRYLDKDGNALDVGSLRQGVDFVAEVKITHPDGGSRYAELALSQVFPSGWEIGNARLDALAAQAESPMDYRDFRDDRVYTFFDLSPGATHVYRVQLTATYQGRFYLPAVSCGAMYDASIQANTAGRWVEVVN